ncbi:MAG: Gfo/Idh/MocA family oxidoreductase [Betaproteobacteria bacterium]|nr:Gfo/Idh/MocA family oxidoreductase [Betaproteobacteria bacterium]
MKSIGVGIIGLGMAVKPHAMALKELAPRIQVAGAFSPSPERRRGFAQSYGLPVVDSLEALLEDAKVQALIILTPPRTHAELALRAARAGKHVLLEKPMDVAYAEAKAIADGVAAAGKRIGVVFQFRFRPGAMALRQLMQEGALGDLLSASASIRWWRGSQYYAEPGRGTLARDGGGVLLTQAIHTLDLMLSLAGPVERVAAQCRASTLRPKTMDTEDIACAALTFRNGAVGVIDATTTAYPGYPERIELAGTKGSAVLEAERLTVNLHGKAAQVIEGSLAGGGGADPMAFPHEPHKKLIEDFLDAIEHDRDPYASGQSALPVHALIDAMLQSSCTGTWAEVGT